MLVPGAVPPCKVVLQILRSTQFKKKSFHTATAYSHLLSTLMGTQRKTQHVF